MNSTSDVMLDGGFASPQQRLHQYQQYQRTRLRSPPLESAEFRPFLSLALPQPPH
ncbi:hypothetical protein [Oscillatoria nigro-viridis]|uniref:hypothetical protein n=1 Tax=Phormidium nigroviride TaxID=482564 RepID=UPI00167FD9DA|nr:hypothetical protein [Oscillatoria nigro-viridis]